MTRIGEVTKVGDRIRKLRIEKELTQRQLAGPGVSYTYVSRIERGERAPSVRALRTLALRLGTTPEYLETGRKPVVTLMLPDYEPFLNFYGIETGGLKDDDCEKLSAFTLEAIKRLPEKNPLEVAAHALSEDRKKREDPLGFIAIL